MPSIEERPPRRRWPRSQRFILSEKGIAAEAEYRAAIVTSRDEQIRSRDAFDAARAAWAKTYGIESDDGLYLCEVKAGPRSLEQLVTALESCDKTKTDAIEALGRTFDAGLVITAPEIVAEVTPIKPHTRRW
jgi:hypothetical protein